MTIVALLPRIPPQLNAYKRQQFRWAKGSIQTLRKLGGQRLAQRTPAALGAAVSPP
jgi:hypothetical protein